MRITAKIRRGIIREKYRNRYRKNRIKTEVMGGIHAGIST